jgi:prepilin-type processing-associated H-X9-DG protein
MSFQAYLDKIEEKTGLTPRALVEQAKQHGYDAPDVKAGVICEWLKADYDLGRGHAMALVHVIKNGAVISDKHVGTNGSHSDASNVLWLDGKATNPAK